MKKNSRGVRTVLMLTAALCFFAGQAHAEDVRIGSGAAAVENIFNKIKGPIAKEHGIHLIISPEGPIQAWKNLDAGKIDVAAGGMSFADWIDLMADEGYVIQDVSVYTHQIIGVDSIKVLTNKDVTLKALSDEQLVGIFTGTIKNWSEFGGPDKPIVVVLGTQIPGTMSEFRKKILGHREYTEDGLRAGTAAEVKTAISTTPGAIGLGAKAQVDSTVNAPRYSGAVRTVTVVTKGVPTPGAQHMIRYIHGEGKQYLAK